MDCWNGAKAILEPQSRHSRATGRGHAEGIVGQPSKVMDHLALAGAGLVCEAAGCLVGRPAIWSTRHHRGISPKAYRCRYFGGLSSPAMMATLVMSVMSSLGHVAPETQWPQAKILDYLPDKAVPTCLARHSSAPQQGSCWGAVQSLSAGPPYTLTVPHASYIRDIVAHGAGNHKSWRELYYTGTQENWQVKQATNPAAKVAFGHLLPPNTSS